MCDLFVYIKKLISIQGGRIKNGQKKNTNKNINN